MTIVGPLLKPQNLKGVAEEARANYQVTESSQWAPTNFTARDLHTLITPESLLPHPNFKHVLLPSRTSMPPTSMSTQSSNFFASRISSTPLNFLPASPNKALTVLAFPYVNSLDLENNIKDDGRTQDNHPPYT